MFHTTTYVHTYIFILFFFFRSNDAVLPNVNVVNEESPDSTEDITSSAELYDTDQTNLYNNLTSVSDDDNNDVLITSTSGTTKKIIQKPNANEQTISSPQGTCSSLTGNYDTLTQVKFAKKLTNDCRYDRLTIPETDGPQIVYLQINLKHIEAIDQLVSEMLDNN